MEPEDIREQLEESSHPIKFALYWYVDMVVEADKVQ